MKKKIDVEELRDKNAALRRLMDFVSSKGRPLDVARAIGMSENIFALMIKRDTKPSFEMMTLLAEKYPDLDIHYIFTGSEYGPFKKLKEKYRAEKAEWEKDVTFNRKVVEGLLGKSVDEVLCPGEKYNVGHAMFFGKPLFNVLTPSFIQGTVCAIA